MTFVLNGKGLLLEGLTFKNRGQLGSRYIIHTFFFGRLTTTYWYQLMPGIWWKSRWSRFVDPFCERRQKPTYHFISIIITMISTLKKMSFMDILTCCPLSSNITMGLSSFSWYTAAPHITVLNMTEAPKPQMYILNDFSKALCFFYNLAIFQWSFVLGFVLTRWAPYHL